MYVYCRIFSYSLFNKYWNLYQNYNTYNSILVEFYTIKECDKINAEKYSRYSNSVVYNNSSL